MRVRRNVRPEIVREGWSAFLQEPFAEWIQGLQLLQALGMKIGAQTARCSLSDTESHGARVRKLLVHTGRSRCGHVQGILITMVMVWSRPFTTVGPSVRFPAITNRILSG
jgi:hypothetical protein